MDDLEDEASTAYAELDDGDPVFLVAREGRAPFDVKADD